MLCRRLTHNHQFSLTRQLGQGVLPHPTFSTVAYHSIHKHYCYLHQHRTISSLGSLFRGGAGESIEMPEPTLEDVQYLESAINEGSRLSDINVQSATGRRALIVAPKYEDHAYAKTDGIGKMLSTVRDAVLMHRTLTKFRGYDPANVRILADGFAFRGVTDPTRENILESLRWLVNGARPGDYRFFHFSGHGVRQLSEKGKGKETRLVYEGGKPKIDDNERSLLKSPSGRIPQQTIKTKDLVYYNQALVTRISVPPAGSRSSELPFYIKDQELNDIFSELPPSSNLTCVIDCCASGRIINNSIKLAGSGFRGTAPSEKPDGVIQNVLRQISPSNIARNVKEVINPTTTMLEDIPQEERDMDHIKANVLTWTSCHQRQDAVNYPDLTSGLFTRLFTEALETAKADPILVEDLFNIVSARAIPLGKESNAWQYVQLWTSMGTDDKEKLAKMMKQPVVI